MEDTEEEVKNFSTGLKYRVMKRLCGIAGLFFCDVLPIGYFYIHTFT